MFNLSTLKNDHKSLQSILDRYVAPKQPSDILNVNTYYKPRKISSFFSHRPRKQPHERSHVVYQFNCPQDSCNAAYIGYTTNSLRTRSMQRRYSSSSIHSHFRIDHQTSPPKLDDNWRNSFTIVHSYNNKIDLLIAEALTIKSVLPYINCKYNEMSNFLKLY